MSGTGGGFQYECEPFVCVRVVFKHPNGSVSHYAQDFSPDLKVLRLKQDMAGKLAVPAEDQVWRHRGRVMEDNQTLDDLEVDPDDVIEITSSAQAQ